jgi:hypothetical protein
VYVFSRAFVVVTNHQTPDIRNGTETKCNEPQSVQRYAADTVVVSELAAIVPCMALSRAASRSSLKVRLFDVANARRLLLELIDAFVTPGFI